MRIGHLTYSFHPPVGGSDTYLQELLRVLREAGHDQRVYQRPVPGPLPEEVRAIPDPLGRLVRRGQFWTLPFGLRALRAELAGEDLLIAHYPNYHRPVESHPRTLLISHGVFWDDRPGALRSRYKRRLALRAYRTAGQVVANDTFFFREMGEDVPVGAAPFRAVRPGRWFLPNCVDLERFRRVDPLADLAGAPIVLVPRNLYRNRGVHLAIEAFALLGRDRVGPDRVGPDRRELRLVVVGADSQPAYRRECEALAARLEVSDRVVFYGPVPWAEMPRAYSSALVTVIPSLCGEGTSLSALESMACGTATVTTAVAGLLDLPAEKAPPEPAALAERLAAVLDNHDAISQNQQRIVRECYGLDRWAEAWRQVVGG